MQFSDTTNLDGLIQACEDYTNLGDGVISADTTLLKQFTRRINKVNRRVWHWIFSTNDAWTFDDGNQTDLPQAVTSMTTTFSRYALPSDALSVERVEVKDASGNFIKLEPLVLDDMSQGVDEFLSSDGTPQYYKLVGETVELFPAPGYDSTGGLKVYFNRDVVEFVYTDTTKEPGFATPYHDVLSVGACLEWLKIHLPNSGQTTLLREEYARYEQDIKEFYASRLEDADYRIKTKKTNFK